ncbi:Rha family transcriptional regulator [Pantoea coffeiphila]|uniref:Transcriptional regulator n=1 Tax=Pantoea coffeiphila TaxID=1465635 RepID=A0A2S9I839_9GAMM|nr:Rha family transcriptional regulator [Pantoea coffeiphila]PRD13962.1 transcriptional regulator [Pantoea coffeiphila]
MEAVSVVNAPEVMIHNGKAVTTSRAVAQYFHKQHQHITQKISHLDCSDHFLTSNFSLVNFEHRGNTYDAYEITKNGFIFLVIGFTGKKAAAFKEAYIAAFDRIEAELHASQQSYPFDGRLLLTVKDGRLVSSRVLPSNQHVMTIEEFLELAGRAGYIVIHEDDLKALAAGKKCSFPAR